MTDIDCVLNVQTSYFVLQNAKCKLHKENGKTIPRRCGLRELDLPDNESGVEYWNPQICRSARCQCVATKEIRKKAKRSIANNKTIIEYRRFKLFECVWTSTCNHLMLILIQVILTPQYMILCSVCFLCSSTSFHLMSLYLCFVCFLCSTTCRTLF